jgi:hypothetical protein
MRHVVLLSCISVGLTLAACGGSESTESTPEPTNGEPSSTEAPTPTIGPPEGVVDFGELPQDHVGENVVYEQSPPVGGPHFPVWQTCDFYDASIPNEQAVHSLEHGAVWITFSPDLSSDQVAAIEALADGEREVLASPYDGLPSPVVASAWGLQLELDSALDPALTQFVDYYENGPQTPEPNTPCAGGTT